MVELPSQLDFQVDGDAVDACQRWASPSLSSVQKPDCRRFKSRPPDQKSNKYKARFCKEPLFSNTSVEWRVKRCGAFLLVGILFIYLFIGFILDKAGPLCVG